VCAGEEELTLEEQLASARHEALTDPVTGLPNRRAFDRTLTNRIEDLRRYGAGFGLLVLDLDHFKRLNLRLGHAGADRVLQRFAEVGAGCLSGVDDGGNECPSAVRVNVGRDAVRRAHFGNAGQLL